MILKPAAACFHIFNDIKANGCGTIGKLAVGEDVVRAAPK